MRHPSKRTAKIAEAEARRKQAIRNNDPEGFAQAVADIKQHEVELDEFTCAHCGEDFPDGPHVEILAAAVLVFIGPNEVERYDYGINDVARGEAPGRRFKFCNECISSPDWKLHPRDYIEMR